MERDLSITTNAPPNSLKDSNVNLKVKTIEGEGVEARSLISNIFKVRGVC